jgi:hypothetical protein
MPAFDVDELKRRFVAAKDFFEFYKYLLTNFYENRTFLKLGKAAGDGLSSMLMEQAGRTYRSFAPPGTGFVNASGALVHVEEHDIVHGSILMNGLMVTVLYFPSMEAGMFAFGGGHLGTQTITARFRLEAPAPPKPIDPTRVH